MSEKNGNPHKDFYPNPSTYMQSYLDSMKEQRANPDYVDVEKIVYELLETTASGLLFCKLIQEQFISVPVRKLEGCTLEVSAMYWEGYRNAFKSLLTLRNSYRNRKEHEAKQAALKMKGESDGSI